MSRHLSNNRKENPNCYHFRENNVRLWILLLLILIVFSMDLLMDAGKDDKVKINIEESGPPNNNDLVFPNEAGNQISHANMLSRYFHTYLNQLAWMREGFHPTRVSLHWWKTLVNRLRYNFLKSRVQTYHFSPTKNAIPAPRALGIWSDNNVPAIRAIIWFNSLKLAQWCLQIAEGAFIWKFTSIPAVRAPSASLIDIPDVIPHEPIFGSHRGQRHQVTFCIEQPNLLLIGQCLISFWVLAITGKPKCSKRFHLSSQSWLRCSVFTTRFYGHDNHTVIILQE